MLWAEANAETAGLIGLAMLGGGAIQWAAAQMFNLRSTRRKEQQEDAAAEMTGLRDLNDRLEKKLDKLETEVATLRDKSLKMTVAFNRAEVWITVLERFLDSHGVKDYPKWEFQDESSSEVHP